MMMRLNKFMEGIITSKLKEMYQLIKAGLLVAKLGLDRLSKWLFSIDCTTCSRKSKTWPCLYCAPGRSRGGS